MLQFGISSYEIIKTLPKEILEMLPTEEEINLHIITNEKSKFFNKRNKV